MLPKLSRRIWKKLIRRNAQPLYSEPVAFSLPSGVLSKLANTANRKPYDQ
jgi:hypothetical protein